MWSSPGKLAVSILVNTIDHTVMHMPRFKGRENKQYKKVLENSMQNRNIAMAVVLKMPQ